MEIELFIKVLIYAHAGFGGIALLAGFLAAFSKKGRSIHKKSGKAFFYSMLLSAMLALVISLLPGHESPFLFAIGIFSSYFVTTGYRALSFKRNAVLLIDKVISGIMIATGLAMIFGQPILKGSFNIVLVVFGILGLALSIQDMLQYRKPEKLKKDWMKMHLAKMLGGLISATTAFVVVNSLIPGIYGWFAPGLLGGFYIAYWIRRLDKGKSV